MVKELKDFKRKIMPNNIKNKIVIIGEEKEVQALVDALSTHYESVPSTSYSGELVYKKTGTDYTYGWLDEKTGVFTTRDDNNDNVEAELTDEWEQSFEDAWTRFPDFNKIKPMPESLDIESGSLGEMGHSMVTHISQSRFLPFYEIEERFNELSEEDQAKALQIGKIYESNKRKYGHTTWYDWAVEHWGTKWNVYSCEKIADNEFMFETAWAGVPHMIEIIAEKYPNVRIEYKYSDEDFGANCGSYVFENGDYEGHTPENCSDEAYDIAFELRPHYKEDMEYDEGEGWRWKEEE